MRLSKGEIEDDLFWHEPGLVEPLIAELAMNVVMMVMPSATLGETAKNAAGLNLHHFSIGTRAESLSEWGCRGHRPFKLRFNLLLKLELLIHDSGVVG